MYPLFELKYFILGLVDWMPTAWGPECKSAYYEPGFTKLKIFNLPCSHSAFSIIICHYPMLFGNQERAK